MVSKSLALSHRLYADLLRWRPDLSFNLNDCQEPRSYAATLLVRNITKKLVDEVAPDADEKAISKFLECNDRCYSWSPDLVEDYSANIIVDSFRYDVSLLTDSIVDNLSFEDLFYRGNLGAGANIGAMGNSFYHKLFAGKLTASSSSLISIYRHLASRDSRFFSAEYHRSMKFGVPEIVEQSNLSTVPKSNDISRTICTEPTLNMFFQQGLDYRLRNALRRYFGIDLKHQQLINRAFALRGSNTGEFATIDLSSASDTISMGFVDWFFNFNNVKFTYILKLLRTPTAKLPNGDIVDLHMISTMGNGFTFSLQTLIFSSLLFAVYRSLGIQPIKSRITVHTDASGHEDAQVVRLGNYAVNGDDIIVCREAYPLMMRVLKYCGFLPNMEKSFNTGDFRESCGVDAFQGTDVRAVYCKSLAVPQDTYSLINRLNVWSAKHRIPLPSTIEYLYSGLQKPLLVPLDEDDVAGIKLPSVLLPKRLNLQQRRSRVGYFYRKDSALSKPISVELAVFGKTFRRGLYNNPIGVYLAALKGKIREGIIHDDCRDTKYLTKWAHTPCWDMNPRDRHGKPMVRLESEAYMTLLCRNFLFLYDRFNLS